MAEGGEGRCFFDTCLVCFWLTHNHHRNAQTKHPTSPLPALPRGPRAPNIRTPPTPRLRPPPSGASSSTLPPLLPAATPAPLPSSTDAAFSLIESQSTPSTGRYIIARLHARNYLLHPRDILTLPTLKPMQAPGTTLSLSKILEVGSREYAVRSPAAEAKALKKGMSFVEKRTVEFPAISPELVRCELTVLEHTKSPMERLLKKKRRKGYKKTIEHKQGWTRLRVGDILLGKASEAGAVGDIQI